MRVPLFGLLLACLTLSGCLQPTIVERSSERSSISLGVVDNKVGGALGSEPSLAIAPDGRTMYVAAIGPSGSDLATLLWRSDDAGATWTFLGTVASIYGSNDADVAVREDGSVWVATMWLRPLSAKCTTVSVSHDKGATWTDNPLVCGTSIYYDERPWLLAGKNVTYLSRYQSLVVGLPTCPLCLGGELEPESPSLAASVDNSRWESHPMTEIPPGSSISPPVMHGRAISLLAFSGDTYETQTGPRIAASVDDGGSWRLTQLGNDTLAGRNPTLAFTDDMGMMAWVAADGDLTKMRLAATGSDGNWGAPWSPEPNGTSAMPWVDANNGHIASAWLWTNETAQPTAVAGTSEWRVHLFANGKVTELPRVVHRGPLCSTYGECPNSGRGIGDFFTMRVLPNGSLAVAIADDATDGGKPMMSPIRVMIAPVG